MEIDLKKKKTGVGDSKFFSISVLFALLPLMKAQVISIK